MSVSNAQSLLSISLVTPSFNQGKFIERTIQSVLSQRYPALDYVVVDGGSTDETLSILKKYNGQLRWVSEKDAGQSDAINKGFRMTHGEILGYLNSDDILLPGSLGQVAVFMQSHPTSAWVTGQARIINQADAPIGAWSARYKNFLLKHFHRNNLLVINFIAQMSTFWRRSALDQVGEFSTEHHLAMDYDFWLRLMELSEPGIIHQDLSCFRIHESAKGSQWYVRQFDESYKIALPYIHSSWLRIGSRLHNKFVTLMYRAKIR